MSKLPCQPSYIQLLAEIKEKIRKAQLQAVIAVNREMLLLYWEIGKAILVRQNRQGWGAKVTDQLAQDLKKEFHGLKGFSRRNLYICEDSLRLIRIIQLCSHWLHKSAGHIMSCF